MGRVRGRTQEECTDRTLSFQHQRQDEDTCLLRSVTDECLRTIVTLPSNGRETDVLLVLILDVTVRPIRVAEHMLWQRLRCRGE